MLGYPSHWGQMECVRLIASQSFPEKRIGYLGLMLLLTEHEEVLTLVTNSIKNDLNHQNQFVVGLALTCVGNLATEDIARDLAPDIDRLLRTNNPYVRKKAALAMSRVLNKVPELTEDFVDRITQLIKDRSHGVQITAVQLMIDVVEGDPEFAVHFTRLVPSLVRILRNLLSMGYSPDHDVSGITDPFLQVKLLRLLRLLGSQNDAASDAMNDMLAQVATNTETAKNAGNAILYECVQTIMSIEAESGLRQLAINILGRFLLNRDNNIRYVALNVLGRVAADDLSAVQRHRNTIVECLKDPDVSLRQRALELVYVMVQPENVEELTAEMLNYLMVALPEQRASIGSHILDTVERFCPSARWRNATLVTLLSIAGNDVDESVLSSSIMYIAQHEELYGETVHKLFDMVKADSSQLALVHCACWCIGEYGDQLLKAAPPTEDRPAGQAARSADEVLDLLQSCMTMHNATERTKAFALNALAKLADRLSGQGKQRIDGLVRQYGGSMALELQQRSVEYSFLLGAAEGSQAPAFDLGALRGETLSRMPVIDPAVFAAKRAQWDAENDAAVDGVTAQMDSLKAPSANLSAPQPPPGASANLLDLDDIFSAPAPQQQQQQPQAAAVPSDTDLLADIFSTPAATAPAPAMAAQPLGDLLMEPVGAAAGGGEAGAGGAAVLGMGGGLLQPGGGVEAKAAEFVAFEKAGLLVKFALSKPDGGDATKTRVAVTMSNSSASKMDAVVMQVATPKFLQLKMEPPSGSSLMAASANAITQVFTLTNPQHGTKNLAVKLRIQYSTALAAGGVQQVTETAAVTGQFPMGF